MTDALSDRARAAGAIDCIERGFADFPTLLLKILDHVPSAP